MKKSNFIVGLILLGLVSCKSTTKVGDEKVVLNPTEFEQKLAELTDEQLVDVRTNDEIASGQLKDAIAIDYNMPNFQENALAKLDKTKPVMLYCYAGTRSKEAADFLRTKGYKVYELDGGISGWKKENKEVIIASSETANGQNTTENAEGVISLANFRQKISGDKPVLVDFSAVWCLPCKKMKPTIDKLAIELQKDVDIVMVDVDKSAEVANAYHVDAMPTLILFKNSQILWQKVGAAEEAELREVLVSKK
jgi:thioredoxin